MPPADVLTVCVRTQVRSCQGQRPWRLHASTNSVEANLDHVAGHHDGRDPLAAGQLLDCGPFVGINRQINLDERDLKFFQLGLQSVRICAVRMCIQRDCVSQACTPD